MSASTETGMELRHLFPNQIYRNDESLTLREVDEDSARFAKLCESIGQPQVNETGVTVSNHGLINPIAVRPLPGQDGKYALIDGFHRLTAWRKVFGDSKPIPAYIKNLSEIQVIKAQVQANALRVETKRAEFATAVLRYMDAFPELSLDEVARDFNQETATIRSWLTLTKLPENLQNEVDNGGLPATVGIVLARFNEPRASPQNSKFDPEIKSFWDKATKEWYDHYQKIKAEPQGLNRWKDEATRALKELKKDRKDNKLPSETGPSVNDPTPVLRSKKEIEIELSRVKEDVETSPKEFDQETMSDKEKEEFTAVYQRGYMSALEWVVSMDPDTFEGRKAKKDAAASERKQATEEKKAGKKAETISRSTSLAKLFGRKSKG